MSRISENFLKFALALAEYETSCSLHDWYGSVVHFAYATEVRRGGAFDPARHSRCLAQSKVRGSWLRTGHLRVFRRRLP